MKSYICLLRGINVSGQKIIKMAELRNQLESYGLKKVKTYIQSGNLFFEDSTMPLEAMSGKIQNILRERYGWEIPCISLTEQILDEVLNNNPYPKLVESTKNMPYVCIPQRALLQDDFELLKTLCFDGEEFKATKHAIYLHHKTPSHKSKMTNNIFEKQLGIPCTTRNWRTLNKIKEIIANY